jgi:hypothetical protein
LVLVLLQVELVEPSLVESEQFLEQLLEVFYLVLVILVDKH